MTARHRPIPISEKIIQTTGVHVRSLDKFVEAIGDMEDRKLVIMLEKTAILLSKTPQATSRFVQIETVLSEIREQIIHRMKGPQ